MYTMPMRGYPTIRITEDVTDHFDIGPWVLAGQALLNIVIETGVTVNSTDATLGGAIYSSEEIEPLRSLVTVTNLGTVLGCNGAGGNGRFRQTGTNGGRGCDGIDLNCPLVIYNTNGFIQSGGGGGGGGGSANSSGALFEIVGGGGSGYPAGSNPYGSWSYGERVQYVSGLGGYASYTEEGSPWVSNPQARGGACNGPATIGSSGIAVDLGQNEWAPGTGGLAGIGVNSNGHGVTIKSGAANIIGGVDLEV